MSYLELMGKLPSKLTQTAERTIGFHVRSGSVFLSSITLVLAATLCLLYFMQINFIAQKGLQLNRLEKAIDKIERENYEISADIDRIEAMSFTKEVAIGQLQMQEIDHIEYWRSSSASKVVAQR